MSARLRLGWVGPLPPATSGIADYSRDLLPALAGSAEIVCFHEGAEMVAREIARQFECRPVGALDAKLAAELDLVVYQIGNSAPHHAQALRKALQFPGVVVLHETMLHHLVRGLTLARGDATGYREEMRYAAGRSGELAAQRLLDTHFPVDVWSFPLFERLVDRSLGVIVHSRFARDRVLASRPAAEVHRVPMGIDLTEAPPAEAERLALRRELGIPDRTFLVASFGFVTPQKRLEPALAAFAAFRSGLREPAQARFALVGEVSPHFDLGALLERLGAEGVTVVGRTQPERFAAWMASADFAVNLRHPTGGETSASFLRLMALGRPVVVNPTGSFAEVPDGACVQLPLDAHEEETLAALFDRFAADPGLGDAIGRAGRRFVEVEHSLARAAGGYLDALTRIRAVPMTPMDAVPPLAPYPASDPWPALLASVGSELADLGLGEDEELLVAVADRLQDLH